MNGFKFKIVSLSYSRKKIEMFSSNKATEKLHEKNIASGFLFHYTGCI